MANCRSLYAEVFKNLKDTVSDGEWLGVQRLLDAAKKALSDNGIDIRTAVDDLKEGRQTEAANKLEHLLDTELSVEAKDIARRAVSDIHAAAKNIEKLKYIRDQADHMRGANPIVNTLRALRDLVSSPREGSISLEHQIRNTIVYRVSGKLLDGMKAKFGDEYYKPLDDPNFRRDVGKEYYAKLKDDKNLNTGNAQAKAYAEHIFDTLNDQRATLNQLSSTTSYRKLGLQIGFNWDKVKAAGRDQFVSDFAEALDPKTHGDIIRRKQISQQIYDELNRSYGNLNWDKIGDLKPQDEMGALDPKRGYPQEPVIEFQSADHWFNTNEKYGSQEMLQSIISRMLSWSRQEAAIKIFGPNPKANLMHLITIAQDGTHEGNSTIHSIITDYERMMEPVSSDFLRTSQVLSTLKNVEAAGHTGGALLSHLTAVPFVAHIGRTQLNISGFRAIAGAFSGGLSAASKELARVYGIVADHMIGHISDQFGLDVSDAGGKAVKYSATLADKVIRISGLDWMMNSLKAGSLGVVRSAIGERIANGTKWADLPNNFRAGMQNFQIGENEWNALTKDNLDNGLFDLFSLDSGQSNSQLTLFDKMQAYIRDNVEKMIITPGFRDVNSLRPFEIGSAYDLVARALTQFQVYPVAIFRRIVYRTLTQQEDPMSRRLQNLAALTAMAVPVAMLKIQAQQILGGKDPYKWDAPDLWVKAVGETGLGGSFYDVLADSGILDPLMKSFGGEETQGKEYADALGPVAGDMIKLLEHGLPAISYGAQTAAGSYTAQEPFRNSLSAVTKQVLGSVPGQNLWYLSLVYQSLLTDTIREAIDPMGYRNARNKMLLDTKNRANSFLDQSSPIHNENILATGLGR